MTVTFFIRISCFGCTTDYARERETAQTVKTSIGTEGSTPCRTQLDLYARAQQVCPRDDACFMGFEFQASIGG